MPKFKITEGGKSYVITVPDGTSQEQAYGYLKQHLGGQQQQQQEQPEPGVLAGVGRFARGAARSAAGGLADAYALSDIPGVGILGAGVPLRLSQMIPGGKDARRKVEEFANAKTPTTEETAGWWTGEAGQALVAPVEGPLALGAKGVKAGTRWLGSKISPRLAEVARQIGTQQAEKAAPEAAAGLGPKPRVRMKASGEVKEVSPYGERTVTNWTKRQMEKHAAAAKTNPPAKPPPTEADVHADFQKVVDMLGEHGAHRLGRHLLHLAGAPPGVSHMLTTHVGRRMLDKGAITGGLAGARTIGSEVENERAKTNPKTIPQTGGSPNSTP